MRANEKNSRFYSEVWCTRPRLIDGHMRATRRSRALRLGGCPCTAMTVSCSVQARSNYTLSLAVVNAALMMSPGTGSEQVRLVRPFTLPHMLELIMTGLQDR